jgi:hypothetical protein
MFLVGLLQWWYGGGWVGEIKRVGARLASTAAFFSIGQLAATLFAPFRQISAGQVSGPVGVQLRAFFDKSISRMIGAVVRFMTIVSGIVVLSLQSVLSVILLGLWLLMPLLPVAGIIMFAIGWTPAWI